MDAASQPLPRLSLSELFFGFLKIGMLGFGGVAPVARHVIVVERRWMTEEQFAALRGYGTVLPGPNVTNIAVMLGYEQQGWRGAWVAAIGILLMPMIIMMGLATVYDLYRDHPMVTNAVYAMAAASGGLIAGTGLKMSYKLKFKGWSLAFWAASIALVAAFHLPLPWVLVGLLPLSIAAQAYLLHRQRG